MGIDPGTAIMGWAIADREQGGRVRAVAYGAVETPPGVAVERRLQQIYEQLGAVLSRYRPDRAVVEQLFFGRNVTTMLAVGQARGVALLACAQAGVPVMELAPSAIKQVVTGYGGADKQQVQRMVQRLLGLAQPPQPDDVADALAVAMGGVAHLQVSGWDGR